MWHFAYNRLTAEIIGSNNANYLKRLLKSRNRDHNRAVGKAWVFAHGDNHEDKIVERYGKNLYKGVTIK